MRKRVSGEDVAAELIPGVSVELLKELHLLTREGDLNADSRRKLKQVNHLLGLLKPAIEDVLARFGDPVIVDCGAGKGYLGFLLHDAYLKPAGKGTVVCVESRADLVKAAEERAKRLGMTRMKFVLGEIAGAAVPERVHLLTALHACDTATDDSMLLALRTNADYVALVPCCQAEVARQLERSEAPGPMSALFAHGWHRREFGSHLTNVLRTLVLESKGFQVTVTELAGWEHSLKNELILAKRRKGSDSAADAKLTALLAATGVKPKVVRELAAAPPK